MKSTKIRVRTCSSKKQNGNKLPFDKRKPTGGIKVDTTVDPVVPPMPTRKTKICPKKIR